jgi:hypothetical protein
MKTTRVEHLSKLHSNGRLLALPANIRLRWKGMAVANTLAYYITATITAVKSFIVQALGWKSLPRTNTPAYLENL